MQAISPAPTSNCTAKGAIATKNLPTTLIAYVGVLISWGVFRLYMFSQVRWSFGNPIHTHGNVLRFFY